MTGISNQVQTPFSSGARTSVALAAGSTGGVSNLPANPNVTVTGTLYGALFTVWNMSNISADGYISSYVAANYDNAGASGVGNALPTITTLDMGSIQILMSALSGTVATLTSLVASNLIQISNDFSMNAAALTTLTLTNLKYVGGQFIPNFASLTSFSMPALVAVTGACTPTIPLATTLSMPLLTYVGSNFNPSAAACTTLDLSSLQYLGGIFQPSFANLATINLPAIVNIGSNVNITAANLVTFSFGSTLKLVGGNVTMTGMKLNQASVDGILVSLAALDGTGGTTSYDSKTVNLSGGTSATPSATGLTAKATLQGRGCTVTTN